MATAYYSACGQFYCTRAGLRVLVKVSGLLPSKDALIQQWASERTDLIGPRLSNWDQAKVAVDNASAQFLKWKQQQKENQNLTKTGRSKRGFRH